MSNKQISMKNSNENLNRIILETKEEYKQIMSFLKEKYHKKELETFSKKFNDESNLFNNTSKKEEMHLKELDNDRLTNESITDLLTYSNLISLLFKQNNLINVRVFKL